MVACICHSPLHHQKPDFEGQSVIKTSSYLLHFVLEAHRESLPRSCETSARRLSAESAEVYSTADLPASAAHISPSQLAQETLVRQDVVNFSVAKSLWGATVTLFHLLGLSDTVLHTRSRKSRMAMTEKRVRVCCTWWWSLFTRGLRLLP